MGSDPVELIAPDIADHRVGNIGVRYVTSFEAGMPGPHVVLNALMHGNELCGAIVLDRFLRGGLRPRRGRLTFAFSNVAAYLSFDPSIPTASRFVEEDMNRVWGTDALEGARESVELRRARELWPVFETADLLLDIHSMQNRTAPLMLCGSSARGRELAFRVGFPGWIIADGGHAAGKRLIDHDRFSAPDGTAAAILAECGQHWQAGTDEVAMETALRFLLAAGTIAPVDAEHYLSALPPAPPPRVVEITDAVTVDTDRFEFVEPYDGMELIPHAGTLIAIDGAREVRTPHDDCLLIMPCRRLKPGQTAVRLGRIVA
ncbi:M14 family metallopeptidase [Indioceanicola profundi]|uniref:succinylglutamate desuccinylase/aspartoacylase domain-containing protein n=1 Tax=Indioceanicola profundi TaxID=2220096 RepID=UPI001CECFE26|nr:succinylglutamate desuccinylase/aspartoacylase family protein [Indioceanicola profundi]